MTSATALRLAAVLGFLAVALGAFGAHKLKPLLEQHQTVEVWRTAVLYHLAHAVVLLFVAGRQPLALGAWVLFVCGIVLFSGSLYVLALGGPRWLGPITPIGGVCFLAGWIWLVVRPGASA